MLLLVTGSPSLVLTHEHCSTSFSSSFCIIRIILLYKIIPTVHKPIISPIFNLTFSLPCLPLQLHPSFSAPLQSRTSLNNHQYSSSGSSSCLLWAAFHQSFTLLLPELLFQGHQYLHVAHTVINFYTSSNLMCWSLLIVTNEG